MVNRVILVAKEPKQTSLEYGVVYPNGNIDWYILGRRGGNIETKEDLAIKIKEVENNYKQECERANITPIPKLLFVSRTKTVKYSVPEFL